MADASIPRRRTRKSVMMRQSFTWEMVPKAEFESIALPLFRGVALLRGSETR